MHPECILCSLGGSDDSSESQNPNSWNDEAYDYAAIPEVDDDDDQDYADEDIMGNTDYIAATVHSYNGRPSSTSFQQSVTFTAKMQENGTSTPGAWKLGSWMIPAQHFPILIAIFIGGLIIMLFILALIIWRCCISPHYKKDYGVKMAEDEGPHLEQQNNHVVSMLPNHSAVFLDPKSGQLLICANRILNPRPGDLISSHWLCTNAVPRSWSAPIHEAQSLPTEMDGGSRSRGSTASATINENCSVPRISEFNPQVSSSIALHEVTSPGGKSSKSCSTIGAEVSELKCRSLPSTMRPKKSGDSVNFSKKKRNRMRNNEAAIIALSKSRSQFFHHKDTDSLVDNEAVIVYDERTAL
ncbi:hypothetical protein M8J76_011868 [Diaphorina citri]|nr:hypothetical protein M8J75_013343 [Diaphorina citri]KAI5737285.1 hypothetical protein M8J76_011868 [Diaphorina citri]